MTPQRTAAPAAGPRPAATPGPAPASPGVLPHRLLGNRAVGQLMANGRAGSVPRTLDPGLRTSLEARFGHDLGSVRIHTGPPASALAAAHRARALTVGENIVFRDYAPHTPAGRWSIAHEVAHVVQQRRGGPAAGEAALESDAEAAARAFVAHPTRPVRVRAGSPVRVSRQAEQAEPEDSISWIDPIIQKVVGAATLGMAGPLPGLLAVAMRGFLTELVGQVSGLKLVSLIDQLRELEPLNFVAGYAAGTVAGLLSPVTDLAGLIGLVRYLPELGKVFDRVYAGGGSILTELASIGSGIWNWVHDLGKNIVALDGKAIAAMLEQLDQRVRKAAASAGHTAARELIKTATGGGDAAKESWVSGLFVGNKSRERGYNIGHTVGAVVSNLLLFVFTEGIGDAIIQIAGRLGKLAAVLDKPAKLLATLGEIVAFIERVIGAAMGVVLKPLEKLLKPLFELLARLKALLERMLGIVRKAPATAAAEVVEAAANKAAPKPAPKPAPKTPAKPAPARAVNDNVELPGGPGKAVNDNVELPGGPGKAANDSVEIGPPPEAPAATVPVAEVEDVPLKATGTGDVSGTPANAPVASAGGSGTGGKPPLKLVTPPSTPPSSTPASGAPKASGAPHAQPAPKQPAPGQHAPGPTINAGGLAVDPRTAGSGLIDSIAGRQARDGTTRITIRGRLGPGVGRQGFEDTLAERAGSDRAHLWGQTFGDEAAAGVMYASPGFNRSWQKRVENRIRDFRIGADRAGNVARLEASVASRAGVANELEEVTYRLWETTPAGKFVQGWTVTMDGTGVVTNVGWLTRPP